MLTFDEVLSSINSLEQNSDKDIVVRACQKYLQQVIDQNRAEKLPTFDTVLSEIKAGNSPLAAEKQMLLRIIDLSRSAAISQGSFFEILAEALAMTAVVGAKPGHDLGLIRVIISSFVGHFVRHKASFHINTTSDEDLPASIGCAIAIKEIIDAAVAGIKVPAELLPSTTALDQMAKFGKVFGL